jgi:hypothetical protein
MITQDQRRLQLFNQIALGDNEADKLEDLGAYTGHIVKNRAEKKIPRVPLTESELVHMMQKNNKMKEIARAFREIDPERNGFVTSPEMDDLFRFHYKEEM